MARAKKLSLWIEHGTVHEQTIKQTGELFFEAANTFNDFCGLSFYLTNSTRSRSTIKFVFRDHAWFKKNSRDGRSYVGLRLAGRWRNWIAFNSEHKMDWDKEVVRFVGHEIGELYRIKHSKNPDYLMHENAQASFWHPNEVLWWQKKFGGKAFTPPEVKYALNLLSLPKYERLRSAMNKWQKVKVKI